MLNIYFIVGKTGLDYDCGFKIGERNINNILCDKQLLLFHWSPSSSNESQETQ